MNNNDELIRFLENFDNIKNYACKEIFDSLVDGVSYVCDNNSERMDSLLADMNKTLDSDKSEINTGLSKDEKGTISYKFNQGVITIQTPNKKLYLDADSSEFNLVYGEYIKGFNGFHDICTRNEGGYAGASLDENGKIVIEEGQIRTQADPIENIDNMINRTSQRITSREAYIEFDQEAINDFISGHA